MKAEVLPALLAAGGGTGMLGAIYWHEYQRDGQMRAGRERVGVRFPAAMTGTQAEQALGVLAGLPTRTEAVCELVAAPGSVSYALQLEAGMSDSVVASISGVLGGLRRSEESSPDEAVTLAVRLYVPAVMAGPRSSVHLL